MAYKFYARASFLIFIFCEISGLPYNRDNIHDGYFNVEEIRSNEDNRGPIGFNRGLWRHDLPFVSHHHHLLKHHHHHPHFGPFKHSIDWHRNHPGLGPFEHHCHHYPESWNHHHPTSTEDIGPDSSNDVKPVSEVSIDTTTSTQYPPIDIRSGE